MNDNRLFDEEEAARELRINREQLLAFVEQGALAAYRFPDGTLRFSPEHILDFLRRYDTRPLPTQSLSNGHAVDRSQVNKSAGLYDKMKEFVRDIKEAEGIEPHPDATEHILTAIGNSRDGWYPRLEAFYRDHKKAVVHQLIGRATAELMDMEATKMRPRSRSGVAGNYTVLRPRKK